MNSLSFPSLVPEYDKTEDNLLLDFFRDRIYKRKKNILLTFIGDTGTSKSYSAVRLGEAFSDRFSIDNIVWNSKDFMALINEEDRFQRGDVIVYDEAGVNMLAQEWYSLSNRLINKVLNTFRKRQLMTIFTLPSYNDLDASARKRIHGLFEGEYVNFDNNTAQFKYFVSQDASRFKKVYLKTGIINKDFIYPVFFKYPQRIDMDEYEKRKDEFSEELNENVEEELLKMYGKDKAKTMSFKRTLKMVNAKYEEFSTVFKDGKRNFSRELIREVCKCSDNVARAVKVRLDKDYNEKRMVEAV